MATYYYDFAGGNDANDGTSFANRKKTLASGSLGAAGDTLKIMRGPNAVSMGQNGTFTNKSLTVSLATGVCAELIPDSTSMVASTNVTCSTSTTRKVGSNSSSVAIASAFTTGKAAYYSYGGGVDFSGYEQITFWIRTNLAIAPNSLRIDLCSDTAGATPVNSFTITQNLRVNVWHAITIDNGAPLDASIASIALNVLIDVGAATILIDNPNACKAAGSADELTLNHLIGKNDGIWYPLRGIVSGSTLTLDTGGVNSQSGAGQGYSGTSETVAIYTKLPIPVVDTAATATTTIHGYAGAAGSSGSHVTISGGWNTTDMTTQDGDTLIDGLCGFGNGFVNTNNRAFVDWSKLGIVRGNAMILSSTSADDNTYTDCQAIGSTASPFTTAATAERWTMQDIMINSGAAVTNMTTGNNWTWDDITVLSNTGGGITFTPTGPIASITDLVANNNATQNVILSGDVLTANNWTCNDSATGLVLLNTTTKLYTITTSGNSTIGVELRSGNGVIYGLTAPSSGVSATGSVAGQSAGTLLIYDGSASLSRTVTNATTASTENAAIKLHRCATAAVNVISERYGEIVMDSSTAPTGATYAWAYNILGTAISNATALGRTTPVATVACKASTSNVFTFWCRRSNTNSTNRLRVIGGRYPGIAADITTTVNPSINTWTQYSITVNPSENCVVDIYFEVYDATAGGNSARIAKMVSS